MNNILFVTGTDTGVGKTFVTCALASSLQNIGIDIRVMKPIETGCENGIPHDTYRLKETVGSKQKIEEIVCLTFREPLAPSVAAKLNGLDIDSDLLITKVKEQASKCSLLIVEGAGGLLVPICRNYTYADFATDLSASMLIVVGSRLGAINHASLTFECLMHRTILTIGYLLNNFGNHSSIEHDNDLALVTNHNSILHAANRYNVRHLCSLPFFVNEKDIISSEEIEQLTLNICDYFALKSAIAQ